MSEKYSIEELIVRFLQQDINEDELRYLKSWLEEDVEHKSYFFELKGISEKPAGLPGWRSLFRGD